MAEEREEVGNYKAVVREIFASGIRFSSYKICPSGGTRR